MKNQTKNLLRLALLSAGLFFSRVQAQEKTLERSVSTDITIAQSVRNALVTDNGIPIYDGIVSATSVSVSLSNGAYIEVNVFRGLDGKRPSLEYRNSTETFIGWQGSVRNYVVDVGIGYYDYAPILKDRKTNIPSLYCQVQWGKEGITPYVLLETFKNASDAYYEGGTRVAFGFKEERNVGRSFTIKHALRGMYEDGAFGYGKALVGIYDIEINRGHWFIQATGYCPIVKNDGQRPRVIVATGARWSF